MLSFVQQACVILRMATNLRQGHALHFTTPLPTPQRTGGTW